jgi:hypothetical protein
MYSTADVRRLKAERSELLNAARIGLLFIQHYNNPGAFGTEHVFHAKKSVEAAIERVEGKS